MQLTALPLPRHNAPGVGLRRSQTAPGAVPTALPHALLRQAC